jgi:hypothetical protein
MGGATLATMDGLFKRNYNEGSDVLIEQQNLQAPFWSKIKVSSLKPSAQGIYSPVIMSGNEQGGAITENEGFPTPDSMNPVQPSIYSKLVVWPFQITGSVIRKSETDKVAFAKGLDATQKDNLARMYTDVNRQSLGNGVGWITVVSIGSLTSGVTVTIDNPFPFRRGMYIDMYVSVGGAKDVDNIQIVAVDYAAGTLTLASSQTWSVGDVICKSKKLAGVTSQANAKEMMGWQGLCDTTTFGSAFQGVSVAANPEWVGNVTDAAVSPVSQDLLQRTYNRNAIIGGIKPDTLMSNYGQARVFLNTELQKTRYEPGTVEGGNVVLKWGTMEWIVDHTYPLKEVGMMSMAHIEKFQTKDVHLENLTGQTLYQIVGFDAIGGYYAYDGNIGTWKRNAHSRSINLIEPSL